MANEWVELLEAVVVEQVLDALSRRQLSALSLRLDCSFSTWSQ